MKKAKMLRLSYQDVVLVAEEMPAGAITEDGLRYHLVPLGDLEWFINISGLTD